MATLTLGPSGSGATYTSFSAAMSAAASSGDTIEIRASSPGGSFTLDNGSSNFSVNKSVTITERSGDTVTLRTTGRFQVTANNVTLAAAVPCTASTIGGLRLNGGGMRLTVFGENFTMTGVDFSNNGLNIGITLGGFLFGDADGAYFQHNRIHDVGRATSSSAPAHCFYIESCDGFTIEDNWLWNADDRGVQMFPYAANGIVRRNVIAYCDKGNIVGNGKQDSPTCRAVTNVQFSKNIYYENNFGAAEFWGFDGCSSSPPVTGGAATETDSIFYRAAGDSWDLDNPSGWTFVGPGGASKTGVPTAGTHYTRVNPQFVAPSTGSTADWALSSGSAAIGYGPAGSEPGGGGGGGGGGTTEPDSSFPSGTSDVGANVSLRFRNFGLVVAEPQADVFTGNSGGQWGSGYDSTTTYGPDTDAYVEFLVAPIDARYEVYARGVDPDLTTVDAYAASLRASAGVWRMEIQEVTDDSSTVLATSSTIATPTAGTAFGIRVAGSTVKGFYAPDGVTWSNVVETTDSTLTDAGYAGFLIDSDDTTTRVRFYAGTIGATPADTTAPTDTTDLVVTEPTSQTLRASFTASASSDTTQYAIRYKAGLAQTFTDETDGTLFKAATNVAPSASVTAELGGFSTGTAYTVAVFHKDSAGNWSAGATDDITTVAVAPADTTAPSAVSGLTLSEPEQGTIRATFTTPADSDTAAYVIRYKTDLAQTFADETAGAQFAAETSVAASQSISHDRSGFGQGAEITVAVFVRDESFNWSAAATDDITTKVRTGRNGTPAQANEASGR